MASLPAVLDDAVFRCVREERPALAAAVEAARAGPQQLMDFLILAGTAASPETLHGVQELADKLSQEQGRGQMCIPMIVAPTTEAGHAFLRAATDEEQLSAGVLGWLLLQARANAPNADVTLPLCTVLAMNITFALLPWWAAVALQPPILFTCTVLQYMAGLVPGVAELRSRMSAIVVAALLLAGVSVFLVTLAPAQLAARPNAVALEAVMFALNAVAFWKTVFTDPGFVPRGTAESASAPGAPRVCATCHCERPLRSKHDPFIGRCVRKFDHYCPLVWNSVGEGNQAFFVLFCFTMLAGQALFLHLGLTFLAEQGEGVLLVLTTRLWVGWVAHPVVFVNLLIQCAALAFNSFLCVRAVYGVAAELTSNEMVNTSRYEYLQHPETGKYDNPFDAGVLANTRRFFAALRAGSGGASYTNWDALAEGARASGASPPPLLSMAVLFRACARIGVCTGGSRKRAAAGAHGHSHGGQECGHDHGHGQASQGPWVRTDKGMVAMSSFPAEVQAQLLVQLQLHAARTAGADATESV